MKNRLLAVCLGIFLLSTLAAGAQQSLSLAPTTIEPTIDGVVNAKEYSLSTVSSGLQLSLSWTADILYVAVAVAAKTSGWVAVGVGSNRMDGAFMCLGYVDGDKVQLKVQKGSGHRHGDTDAGAPVASQVKEVDGTTTLEVALKTADFIAKGQKQLDLIMAMGGSKSFVSPHRARGSVALSLAQ